MFGCDDSTTFDNDGLQSSHPSGTQYLTCSDPSHRNQINRPLVISGHGTYDYLRSHMTVTPTHIFIFVPIIPIRQYKYDPNLMFIHFVTQELSSSSSVTGYNNNYSLVHTVTESGQYHRPHRPVSLGHTRTHTQIFGTPHVNQVRDSWKGYFTRLSGTNTKSVEHAVHADRPASILQPIPFPLV